MGYILDTDQIAYYAVQISISQASIHTFKGAVFLLTPVKKKKKSCLDIVICMQCR